MIESARSESGEQVKVLAPCGPILGRVSNDPLSINPALTQFLGVPYAEPPVGDLRFQPPVPKASFTEPFEAFRFSPASAQVFDPKESKVYEYQDDAATDEPTYVGVENSLTLNVWTPGCDDRKRPVIVFIHGGANWLESSRVSLYHGDSLARRGDLVVVTLNYRLGIFGALDLSVLGAEAPQGAHANCVRDQLCAIDWVRRNIAAFGGDPSQITLVGESAGSMDISWMIAAGELRERVRRVVMMSGVGSVTGFGHDGERSTHSLEEGRDRAKAFLSRLKIQNFEQLKHTSTEELLTRAAEVVRTSNTLFEMDTLFYPRVDPTFAPTNPFVAAAKGAADGLEVLIGFTQYELGLWLTWDEQLDQHSPEYAAKVCPFLPNDRRAELAALYRKELAQEPEGVRGMHLLSDAMFGAPSLIFADGVVRSNPNCWMYRFDYPGTDPRRGALHAADIAFFLGTWDSAAGRALIGESLTPQMEEERKALSQKMQDSLTAFARTGSPQTAELPEWSPFTSEKQSYMQFNRACVGATEPLQRRGEFWLNQIAEPFLD